MKAAFFYDGDDIKIKEIEVPKIGDKELLINMRCCGICGTDLSTWRYKERFPCVLGHEVAGEVSDLGENVRGFKVGDRVFVHHHIGCLNCEQCRKGNFTLCSKFRETMLYPGGFSEFFRVPEEIVEGDTLLLPEGISFENASLIEPFACVLRNIKKCAPEAGDNVALIGDGPTSIMHVILLRLFGVSNITVLGHWNFRLNVAKENGADLAINTNEEDNPQELENKFDCVILTAPVERFMDTAFKLVKKGGTISLFALYPPNSKVELYPSKIFDSEIKLIASYSASHIETREVLSLMSHKRILPKNLITHRFDLKDIREGFKTARRKDSALKVIISNERGEL